MATRAKSSLRHLNVSYRLDTIPAIAIEPAATDPKVREAAWQAFVAFARHAKEPGKGTGVAHPYGTRDEWYDEMIDERIR